MKNRFIEQLSLIFLVAKKPGQRAVVTNVRKNGSLTLIVSSNEQLDLDYYQDRQ